MSVPNIILCGIAKSFLGTFTVPSRYLLNESPRHPDLSEFHIFFLQLLLCFAPNPFICLIFSSMMFLPEDMVWSYCFFLFSSNSLYIFVIMLFVTLFWNPFVYDWLVCLLKIVNHEEKIWVIHISFLIS